MTSKDMRIHPINTEADHDAAVRRISQLMGAKPGTPEGDELDILATLVDVYEARNHPMDAPDPITAIEFRIEQQGLTRKDLEPIIGSRARVSEVLTGKRKLTIEMIRRLRAQLGISADSLIASVPEKAANRVKIRSRRSRSKRMESRGQQYGKRERASKRVERRRAAG